MGLGKGWKWSVACKKLFTSLRTHLFIFEVKGFNLGLFICSGYTSGIDCILVSFMNQTKSFEITNVFREISIKCMKGKIRSTTYFLWKGGWKQNGTGSMIKIRSVISPPILHPEREHLNCLCPVMHNSHLSLLSAMRGGSRLGFSMDSICGQRRK